MIALAFIAALIALMPFASGYFMTVTTAEPAPATRSAVNLDNFLAYRSGVMTYAENNPSFTGTVSDIAISSWMPPGYQKLGPWTNQVSATQIVVYGASNIGMVGASTLSSDSVIDGANYLVGYAKEGNWETTAGGMISTAPAYVPAGAVLAIINK